jgi:hypothetical protein
MMLALFSSRQADEAEAAPVSAIAVTPSICFALSLNFDADQLEIIQLYSKCSGLFAPGSLEILGDCDHEPGECSVQKFGDNDGELEPSDFARMELDGNQVRQRSPQGYLWIIAFVDDDDPIRFTTNRGKFLTEENGLVKHWQCDNTIPLSEQDEDCDGDGLPGDGIVVARLTGTQTGHISGTAFVPDTFAELGPGNVEIQQGKDLIDLPFTIVGEPDKVSVLALQPQVQDGAGDNNNDDDTSDTGECPFIASADALFADNATAERTILLATVLDNDGNSITGAFIEWTTDDEDVGVTATGTTPTIDLGTFGFGAPNLLCGTDAPGTVTVKAQMITDVSGVTLDPTACEGHPPPCASAEVEVEVVGLPSELVLSVTPPSIACDGVQSAEVAATMKDAAGKSVVDGTEARFDVQVRGTANPIVADSVGGVAKSLVIPLSVEGETGVPVVVTAGEAASSILVNCSGAGAGAQPGQQPGGSAGAGGALPGIAGPDTGSGGDADGRDALSIWPAIALFVGAMGLAGARYGLCRVR